MSDTLSEETQLSSTFKTDISEKESSAEETVAKEAAAKETAAKKVTAIVYLLQALGLVFAITLIAGVILNYIKQDDIRGTFAESHVRWQIRTFWFALLWWVVGVITSVIFIGFLILFANTIWFIYRIVKGGLYLSDRKPMYVN